MRSGNEFPEIRKGWIIHGPLEGFMGGDRISIRRKIFLEFSQNMFWEDGTTLGQRKIEKKF